MRNASKIDPACSSISNAMRKISTMDAAVQTEPLALFFALDSCGDWRAHGQFNEKQREVLNDLEKVLNKTNLDSLKASFGEMMPSMQLVHSSTSADNLENDMNAVSSTKTSPVKEDTQRVDKKQDDFKAFDREKPTRKNTSKASPTFKRLVNGLSFGQLDDLEQIIKNSSTAGSEENVGVISKELQSFKSVSAEDISNASQLVSIKKYCLNAEAKEFVPQNVSVADVAEDKASEATVTASCGSEIQKRTASKSKSNESHEVSKQAPKREWIKKSDSLKHKLAPKLASSEVPSGKTSECVSKDVSGPEAHQVVSLESPEAEVSKISNITSTDEKSLSAPSTDVSISVSPVEPSVGEANVSLKQNSNRSSSKSSLQVNPSPENKPAVDVVPKIPVKPPGSPKATKLSTTKPEVKQTAWNKPAWLKRQLQDAKEEGKHPSSVSRPVVRNVGNQVPGHFVKPVVRRIVPKVPTTSVKTALSSSSLSSCSTTSSGDVASKRKRIVDDDGWETVKGRSRSRISPVKSMMESSNDVSRSSENILRRSSVASSVRPRPAHERFLLPSGAVSLPSVVVIDDVCDDRSSHSTVSKQASLGTGPVEELKTEKSLEARVVSESEVTKNADPKKQRPSPNNERALKKKTKKKSQEDISSRVAAPVSESKSSSTGVGIDVSQRVGKSSASLGVLTVLDSPRSPELNPDADAILDAQDDEELKANEQAFASVVKEEETLEEAMRLEFEKGAAEEAAERERLTNGVSTEDEVDDHVHSIDDSGDLEQLKALSVTYDGKLGRQSSRVFHIHEKLSSPSRRTTAEECMKRREERQAKADELRQSRLQSHKEKMEELTRKIEEVRAMKSRLLEKNRMTTERKLKRAEEKRKLHLQSIVKKAHDEEEKAKEIAFINSLEASNKRQEINQQLQIVEARLQEKNDERQRKNEEKAAKEAAAEERRKVMEAERLARIDVIVKKREYRERQIAEDMTRKEELRLQLAREKARSREERVSAINAKQIADAQKLQRKIALKHEESARRHEEKIDDIRRKAFESTVLKYSTASDDSPTLVSYETAKMCTLCQVIIGSEIYLLSHLKGQVHRSAVGGACVNTDEMGLFNLAHIVDAPDDEVYKTKVRLDVDRQKACRKRCGKLRSRMHQRAQDFSQWLSNATGDTKLVKSKDPDEIKLLRCVKDVEKLVASQAGGRWENSSISVLERSVLQLSRLMKSNADLKVTFGDLGGFSLIVQVLKVIEQSPPNDLWIPSRCLVHTVELWETACKDCPENSFLSLYSDAVCLLIDQISLLLNRMIPDYASFVPGCAPSGPRSLAALTVDPVASSMVDVLTTIFSSLRTAFLGVIPVNLSKASKKSMKKGVSVVDPSSPHPYIVSKPGSAQNGGESTAKRNTKGSAKSKDAVSSKAKDLGVDKKESGDAAGTKPSAGGKHAVPQKAYGIAEEIALQDAISYTVAVGIVDKLAQYIACVQGPINGDSTSCWEAGLIAAIYGSSDGRQKIDLTFSSFVEKALLFVTAMTKILGDLHPCPITPEGAKNIADPTSLLPTIQLTELVSSISLLYVLVVHQQSRPPSETGSLMAPFSNAALALVLTVTSFLNSVARLHPYMLQGVLGAEGLNLQFRHIASYLLWYCSQWPHEDDTSVRKEDLLKSVIWLIGYFAVGNAENQSIIQSGQMPSVLHQLCSLPLPYFTDNSRKKILYPTLIACILDKPMNAKIVEEEVALETLKEYLHSTECTSLHLIELIKVRALASEEWKLKGRGILTDHHLNIDAEQPANV